MDAPNVAYKNKFCKITETDNGFILSSRMGRYPDQHYDSIDAAMMAIGIVPENQVFTFMKIYD